MKNNYAITDNLLSVIEAELDKKFYGMKLLQSDQAEYSTDEYIQFKIVGIHKKYNFLIMAPQSGVVLESKSIQSVTAVSYS